MGRGEGAESGLETPDAGDGRGVDAEFALRLRKPGFILLGRSSRPLDAIGRDGRGEIDPDRLDEFGLADGMGNDLRVESHAFEGEIEGLARNAARLGLRPEAF